MSDPYRGDALGYLGLSQSRVATASIWRAFIIGFADSLAGLSIGLAVSAAVSAEERTAVLPWTNLHVEQAHSSQLLRQGFVHGAVGPPTTPGQRVPDGAAGTHALCPHGPPPGCTEDSAPTMASIGCACRCWSSTPRMICSVKSFSPAALTSPFPPRPVHPRRIPRGPQGRPGVGMIPKIQPVMIEARLTFQ